MKKLLYIFFLSWLIISCHPGKSISKSTTDTKKDSVVNTSLAVSSKNDSTITDKTKKTTQTGIVSEKKENRTDSTKTNYRVVFFDTSKPVTLTGKPPVSSIFESTAQTYSTVKTSDSQQTNIRNEIENNIRKEYENKYTSKFDSMLKLIEQLNAKVTVKTKKGFPPLVFILTGAVIATVVYFIIYIIKRVKKVANPI